MATATATPGYFRAVIRLIRPFPNFDLAFIRPLRAKAARLLRLRPGARVLDLGCGPGGSFPYLVEAVGPAGQVVGVEISPDVALNATRRIAHNGWANVQVLVTPAESAPLDGTFDGALMFGAPDVFASGAALGNILPHLRPGARVVFFGAKTSQRRLGWILNPSCGDSSRRSRSPRRRSPTTRHGRCSRRTCGSSRWRNTSSAGCSWRPGPRLAGLRRPDHRMKLRSGEPL